MDPDIVWAAIISVGLAYETYTLLDKREGNTLSEVTRSLFRVHTSSVGRSAFLVVWSGFALWFAGHVLDWWA